MDYLWTPWRYAYITAAGKASGCIFCEAPKAETTKRPSLSTAPEHCYVILNAYPYTNGHVMVVPYAHLDELQKLPTDPAAEMMTLTQRIEGVLRNFVPAGRDQPGDEHREGRRGRNCWTHPHACFATLGGRRQFHERSRRSQGPAGNARCDMEKDSGRTCLIRTFASLGEP